MLRHFKREGFSNMDSKKAQKLSKAAVAAALATSGVLVAMPHKANAYSFSDVNPNTDYYEPIIDLANRKIATGYSNGTFKPNAAITREDAAKMLALTIDVNITKPKDPGFKDVARNNPNYRYIAALAEAGVINGFPDKTFKPKEPITRGQMAKILALGFKFGISTKLNHSFKDVSNKNANAYFIQTIYDLNITKGKTPISFDPFNIVTRAQMATFIWRAEKADRGNPVYTVGEIVGNQIYINGVAYTVASHLRSIINAGNQNILKGAYIEGSYSGKTLQNISKLTINASGNSTRLLALDGGHSSFAGELVIHGSYLRFKNINFTGRVEVAEAPRRSLGTLENVRIASTGNFASFIDWGTPTNPKNEDFLNPVDKETLQNKPDPTKPENLQKYTERLANVKKYVDFENSGINDLYVTADRTFLKANFDIDRLTVQGNVANMELYASPKAMYIDTDYNVSIYGVHNIQYVYKNTLKNVFLNTNSIYNYYYIASSNGFTNLGTHASISKAVIPKNKTVNDVFDDYKTDDPNIGYVEDENGKAVDRNPVENTIVTDVTSPTITQLDVAAGGSTADVTLKADEDGTYYYVIKKANEKAPTISEIKTGGTKFNGNGPLIMHKPVKFTVSGLETMTDYVIYAIVIDDAENVSEKKEQQFSTIDNRPLSISISKLDAKPGGKRFEFTVDSKPGEIFYLVRQEKEIDKNMTVDYVINNKTASRKVAQTGDQVFEVREYGTSPRLNAVQPSTDYVVYAVMVDLTGNKTSLVEAKQIKTAEPDSSQPYVANNAELKLVDEKNGVFEFTVSELLNPESALDKNNYTLSGTGILNVSGQKTINPSKVEVNDRKVRLTIPALNALVKSDTIRVTVSKNVLDLAENEFEHSDRFPATENAPRNEAYYEHVDNEIPKMEIKKVLIESTRNLVEFKASKAGTYYYMILEDDYDFNKKEITPRDFVDEFESKNINTTTKFGERGSKDYPGNLLNQFGPAELNLNSKSINIDFASLNPFRSYSLYMVLKDRAGLLAKEIVSMPIVSDSKAPLISNLIVKPKSGEDDVVTFSFTADEAGDLLVIPVRKYILNEDGDYVLNSKFFEIVDGKAVLKQIPDIRPTTSSDAQRTAFNKLAAEAGGLKKVKFNKGINSNININGLNVHQEYGFYIAADDTKGENGNFTIFQRKDEVTDPPSPIEPNGDQMIRYVYTDGIKPSIIKEGIVSRKGQIDNPNSTFIITFNEAILRQKGDGNPNKYNKSLNKSEIDLSKILSIKDSHNNDITNKFIVEDYQYNVARTNTQSELVLKPTDGLNTANTTFTVTMKESLGDAYDYAGVNTFDISKFGKYIYRKLTSDFVEITRNGSGLTPTSSYKVTAVFDLTSTDPTYAINEQLNYYYASYSSILSSYVQNLEPDKIVEIANSSVALDQALNRGKGYVNAAGGRANIPLEHSTGFYDGDYIVIVLEDKYGNRLHGYQKVGHQRQ